MQSAAIGNKKNNIQGFSGHVFEDFGTDFPSAIDQYGFGSPTGNPVKQRKSSPNYSVVQSNVDIVLLDQERLSLVGST